MCEDHGAKIIDINMGCPAKKVVNGCAGSALMQDIKAAKEIIEHVVNAVKVPVTLKTRLGWDDKKLNAPELCLIAQDLGTQLITLHGRTRCQFFKGTADWERISDTVNELQIPVIANGDITDVSSARRALKLSGAAGIMIGRGVGGKPWLLAEVSHVLFNTKPPKIPSAQSFCEMMVLHYEAALTFYGDTLGVRSVRKHINWYLGYMGITDGKIRKKILTEENPSLVINMIKSLIDLER
jgi:nifR3 family TIM-barrel protein